MMGGGQFSEASCCVTNIIVVRVFLVLYGVELGDIEIWLTIYRPPKIS